METALRPWVAGITETAYHDRSPVHVREPDTATVLTFRMTPEGRGDLLVMGPRTRASYLTAQDVPHCVQVRLRPGRARPLLGVPVSELVDRIVPLGELWGAAGDRLADELTVERAAEQLEAALMARLAAQSPGDLAQADLLHEATLRLTADRVPAVAGSLGVSERHLRNLFTGGVGVAPKRFVRIGRVRDVLGRTSKEGWASLAADTGYYDQSHMTADFRAVMGVPPGAFSAGRLPAASTCPVSVA